MSHDPSIRKTVNFSISWLLHFSLHVITIEFIASFQHLIMRLPLSPSVRYASCLL